MAKQPDYDQAKLAIEGGLGKAQEILNDPSQLDAVLKEIQEKAKDLPSMVGGALVQIPTMAEMIKGYVTKEYTEVSPKVVVSVLSALLYLVKGKDIIPDSIPIIGLVDDIAVITVAMKLCEQELADFKAWKAAGGAAASNVATSEALPSSVATSETASTMLSGDAVARAASSATEATPAS